MRTTDNETLISEFDQIKNNWKSIYQWKRINSKGNTEIISEWLIRDFDKIVWSDKGLRQNNFKVINHEGQCALQTPITQFTEKRFCRALYNEYNKKPHPLLGLILDYEVPLTAREQSEKVNQGDIDIVSERKNELLFIEAKTASSTESLLKAILEIFVYVIRLSKYGLLQQFLFEFKIHHFIHFIPCILTFKNSTSGKQIMEIHKYPKLLELIAKINSTLIEKNLKELEFYVVEYPNDDFTNCLRAKPEQLNNREFKIFLNGYVKIIQYFPNYGLETFLNKLDKNVETKQIEMILNSFLLYYKKEAIQYINKRLNYFMSEIEKYNNIHPKNIIVNNEHDIMFKKEYPFSEAYINIADIHNCFDFLNINLKLLNPYQIKSLVPIVSIYKSDEILDKLIELYQNIRVIKQKDYDGVSATEIDFDDERIIISALCQYDNPKIIPLLKNSILNGKIGETKSMVIKKLLTFITKEEILQFIPDYSKQESWMITTLTNKKVNAEWVIKYLNEN